jgi:hypothetical protein
LLRYIVQSLPTLVSLHPAGIPLPGRQLFNNGSTFNARQAVTNNFANITKFTLVASRIELDGENDEAEGIDEEDLQGMLNNLSGLQELSITGYSSFSTSPILPTASVEQQLRSTIRLPNRARLSSLKLRHLSLFNCSFTSEGLKLLLGYIAPETLDRLTIIEHMESTSRSGSEMFPTLVVLNELISSSPSNLPGSIQNYGRGDGKTREGIEALWTNIRGLNVGLYNWPTSSTYTTLYAPASFTTRSTTSDEHGEGAIIERLFPHLSSLEHLILAGSVCQPTVLDCIPNTVKEVVFNGCAGITSQVVEQFLDRLTLLKDPSSLSIDRSINPISSNTRGRTTGNKMDRKSGKDKWSLPQLEILEINGSPTISSPSKPPPASLNDRRLFQRVDVNVAGRSGARWILQEKCWAAGIVLQERMQYPSAGEGQVDGPDPDRALDDVDSDSSEPAIWRRRKGRLSW